MRTGPVTAAAAICGLLLGAYTGYGLGHHSPSSPLILRQSSDAPMGLGPADKLTTTPGAASQVAVSIRNDSPTTVEVVGAALSGQAARIGPLSPTVDIAAGGSAYVIIAVPYPNGCGEIASDTSYAPRSRRITVFARLPGASTQQVPLEITGASAALLDACAL